MRSSLSADHAELSIGEKLWSLNWSVLLVIVMLGGIGFGMLYSAAGGDVDPWASRQAVRFAMGLSVLFVAALIDVRIWLRLAYPVYILTLGMLVAVEFVGDVGKGAQRWIDLGIIQFQPSEAMKIAIVLAVARYFHGAALEDVARPFYLVPPLILLLAPVGLVLIQPDLGTALKMLMVGGALFFAAGVRLWKFAVLIVTGLASIPVAWQFLHDYQKDRVLTFLNPESDPLGAGYHTLQSKIALGSGGLAGKGFLEGTQSHLNFLPEKQTDFIFTMLAEEWGMLGGLVLLGLYTLLFAFGLATAVRVRSQFGRLLALGVTVNLFLYVFINIAMVMGLIPVVGVPLPLISYGGTALLTVMFGFGLLMSASIHRDVRIPRRALNGEL